MIMILIDYSKYKVKEANFEFWDELTINIIPITNSTGTIPSPFKFPATNDCVILRN